MSRLTSFIISIFLLGNIVIGQTIKPKSLVKLIRKGDLEKVKTFIDKDSTLLTIRTKNNGNLLTVALWYGRIEIAKYLIEKNININVQETRTSKYTPLHISTSQRQNEITYLLVKKGANLNSEATHGSTPLRNAMQLSAKENDKDIEIFKLLVDNGADFKCRCVNCCQANYLMFALNSGKTSIAKYLIEKGIDLSQKNCNGYNALHFAVGNGNFEVTKILVEKDVDHNEKTNNGNTALDLARKNKDLEIINYLEKL